MKVHVCIGVNCSRFSMCKVLGGTRMAEKHRAVPLFLYPNMNNEERANRCGTRMSHVKRRLRPLMLAVLCPLMAYADGDVGVKATVREGTTVRESAQFQLSKTPRISFDSDGKVVMKLGDNNTNVAELPIKNGAELHVTMQDYDESQNKLNATVSAAGYSTLYSAFQLTVPSDVEVYAPEYDAEKNELKMYGDARLAEGTILPPATGVVLKNQGEYEFYYSDAEPADVSSSLTGSVVSAPITDFDVTVYSLSKEGNTVAFSKYEQPTTVAGKAYLALNDSTIGQVTLMFDDIATNISESLSCVTGNTPSYNLAGQQVGGSYHGIIIQNGKKISR